MAGKGEEICILIICRFSHSLLSSVGG